MKTKIWFVYKGVTKEGKLSSTTKRIIRLIKQLEKTYNKEMFDLRSIEYTRFLTEFKDVNIGEDELPAVLINKKICFKGKLPLFHKFKKEIDKIGGY